jgi:hypothetical protein
MSRQLLRPGLVAVLLAAATSAAALDPDALSQRYRNWHYYPDWIIPPLCMNPFTCKANASGGVTDVFQLVQLPEEPGMWRAFYLGGGHWLRDLLCVQPGHGAL